MQAAVLQAFRKKEEGGKRERKKASGNAISLKAFGKISNDFVPSCTHNSCLLAHRLSRRSGERSGDVAYSFVSMKLTVL